ncbi:hypothetical protein DP130_06745 [Clostridium tetani]|uniref:Uncharacterized protein n=1 Tax=Clostridium tetani TaxID=1513 RepID=A0A4Q0VC20_CLOTA|nr:hypothetical protein [Clostridium tetani]RXI49103.1 hypothetical protein DP130_06745 [Clostridium tetani]
MYNCCWPYMPYMDMCDDSDLERMYPEIYRRVYPMVIVHCDRIERQYGWMCCPSNESLNNACEDIYENIKDCLDEIYAKDDDKCYRQFDFGRRRSLNDLFRILLIRELLGRRRRRRRRRRPGFRY